MNHLLLVIHEMLCVTLWYTVFCRAVRTDARVKLQVRAAFVLVGAVALLGFVAHLAWGWEPDLWDVILLAAVVILQVVTATNWKNGVPDRFLNPKNRPRNRRATDRDVPTCQT